ncbi:unnamed protein product [Linum trigynum]|uniref:Pentatricopeptide repeat-containing protein n=1 Tax=Linum trigynum TaxID=586398 RepID=A0AAV2DLK0_9ROSI
MALSRLHTNVVGLGHLQPTCAGYPGPDDAAPSPARHQLKLQLPPPRRPSTPQRLHLQQQQQKPIVPCTPTKPIKGNDNSEEGDADVRSFVSSPRKNKAGCAADVLRLFDTLCLPVAPDLCVSLIKECTNQRDKASALQLHARTSSNGLLNEQEVAFLNRLLLMHVSCGHFDLARQLFDQMPGKRDAISWAIIITGYSHDAQHEESIGFFIQMLSHDYSLLHFPQIAMASVLKACVYTENQGLGKQLHGLLFKCGSTCADGSCLDVSLNELHGNLGPVKSVNHVFDKFPQCNSLPIWSTKLANSYREGRFSQVVHDSNRMGRDGICRISVLTAVLRACAKMDDGGMSGRQVHAIAIKQGLEGKVVIQCGLIKMYGSCGMVEESKQVFKLITDDRDDAHWNAMLTCYLHNGFYVEALKLLYQMKAAAIEVTESLLNRVRLACGTGTLENTVRGTLV